MRALGIIIARGGSKGIPRKNVRLFAGRPLIAHTIAAARDSQRRTRTVVSTDDAEIANAARLAGGEVPFVRPSSLAGDEVPAIDVVLHALGEVEREEGRAYDAVVLLQPTTPLRLSDDVDGALALLESSGADSVLSCSPPLQGHPHYMYTLDDGRLKPLIAAAGTSRRQEHPVVYVRNGAVYATRRDALVRTRSFYGDDVRGFVMPSERMINIDTELDWQIAEALHHLREARR